MGETAPLKPSHQEPKISRSRRIYERTRTNHSTHTTKLYYLHFRFHFYFHFFISDLGASGQVSITLLQLHQTNLICPTSLYYITLQTNQPTIISPPTIRRSSSIVHRPSSIVHRPSSIIHRHPPAPAPATLPPPPPPPPPSPSPSLAQFAQRKTVNTSTRQLD